MAMFSVDADAAQAMIDYSGFQVCRYRPGKAMAVLMLMRYVGSMPALLPVAGIWIALNVFFGIFGGTPGGGGEPVAWTAHIGGFVYGLVALRLFIPAALAAPSQPPPADGTG